VFPKHITVILAFKVILNKCLYKITTYIKNSIDILINTDYFEIENGHFPQTGDNSDLCLHKSPSDASYSPIFFQFKSKQFFHNDWLYSASDFCIV
jgi:hypothetical protein